jgi:L-amino acid N-acyltransferase YncA
MSTTFRFNIRPVAQTDVPAIASIINHYIANTAIRFDTKPFADTEWYEKTVLAVQKAGLPYLVAIDESQPDSEKMVVGFASVSRFRPKGGYRHTAELSLYAHPEWVGKGVGTVLLQAIMHELEKLKQEGGEGEGLDDKVPYVAQLLAVIALDVHGSQEEAERSWKTKEWYEKKWGFVQSGRLRNVGFKFGRW